MTNNVSKIGMPRINTGVSNETEWPCVYLPIIDKAPVEGLFLDCGWNYGGFKATPASGWAFAHLLAKDEPHKTATAYRFDRFLKGLMIDEKGQGAQPNLH